jgi:CheY-like chemotaxis protein
MYSHIPILVAEDNEDDAFFLKRAFLRAGVNAPLDFVENGDSAVGYLSGRGHFEDRSAFPLPKLLILDLKMPGIDGFGVLEWLRAQPGLRRLPVLVFSSSAETQDVNRAHELGANGFTVKPNGLDAMHAFVLAVEAYWLRCHIYPTLPAKAER